MFFARQVFRCFRFVEKLGERLLGAVGPYFVATAVVLLSVGVFCFCTLGPPQSFACSLFIEFEFVYSRSYMANAILPFAHNTNMPSDRVQPLRALLLCLHRFARFR